MSTDRILRNEKGYPLLESGEIDWELTSKEKSAYLEKYERGTASDKKKSRNRNTNFIPKKKKRK